MSRLSMVQFIIWVPCHPVTICWMVLPNRRAQQHCAVVNRYWDMRAQTNATKVMGDTGRSTRFAVRIPDTLPNRALREILEPSRIQANRWASSEKACLPKSSRDTCISRYLLYPRLGLKGRSAPSLCGLPKNLQSGYSKYLSTSQSHTTALLHFRLTTR